MPTSVKTYFRFTVSGTPELHAWLAAVAPIVEEEIAVTLAELAEAREAQHEEILVFLHYMYFYRFALPVLEATAGRRDVLERPDLARFQLLTCLAGRFLDDLVDADSGFWGCEVALRWFSHYLRRCERVLDRAALPREARANWCCDLRRSFATARSLYDAHPRSGRILPRRECPLPLVAYPDRVPYFFTLPRVLDPGGAGRQWAEDYVSALFFHYDIDDAINDIHRNVATEPAHHLLLELLDDEGRLKLRRAWAGGGLRALFDRGRALLVSSREAGRERGLELGPAMIDAELEGDSSATFDARGRWGGSDQTGTAHPRRRGSDARDWEDKAQWRAT